MWWLASTLAFGGTPDAKDSLLNSTEAPVAVRLRAELGTVGQLRHQLQINENGTDVSLPKDLAQDVLFAFTRLQVDLDLGKNRRDTLILLYQPLVFASQLAPDRDLQIGDVTFAQGRALSFRYSFPYYRLTWLHDTTEATDREIAFGLGLQIRNASIGYTALDGSQSVITTNIGPVPLLAFRQRHTLTKNVFLGSEIQGFYAPISLINGSTSDVEGAIADARITLGLQGPKGLDGWVSLRYIGGGAVGTSNNADPFTDGFTRNWLHTLALTVGSTVR
ncbi:MAG: hypothetical protein AAGA48_11165 [Myxococcota bacterium]